METSRPKLKLNGRVSTKQCMEQSRPGLVRSRGLQVHATKTGGTGVKQSSSLTEVDEHNRTNAQCVESHQKEKNINKYQLTDKCNPFKMGLSQGEKIVSEQISQEVESETPPDIDNNSAVPNKGSPNKISSIIEERTLRYPLAKSPQLQLGDTSIVHSAFRHLDHNQGPAVSKEYYKKAKGYSRNQDNRLRKSLNHSALNLNSKSIRQKKNANLLKLTKEESCMLHADSDEICDFIEEYQNLDMLFSED